MTALSTPIKLCVPVALALLASTNPAYAQCSRNDIDHYLSKGFTTEQITAICSAPVSSTEKVNKSVESDKNQIPPGPSSNDELFLREALKVHDMVLTGTSLQFTRKICVEFGDEDLYGFASRACPEIRYEIALNGLEVIKSEKKYLLYGDEEIHVKSNIKRDVIEGLDKFKPEQRELILNKLESGDQTMIPVREDISTDRVKQVLEDLSI